MYRKYVKRILDLIIALVAIPFFVLILIVVSPMIWLTDRGPIFYNAERIDRHGKPFKMYKFRSMKVNAPDLRLADGSTYNGKDDPRVTKVGKILRDFSIDETPQILNILLGDMSLIGPRPDLPDEYEKYPKEVKESLIVYPGVTGYSSAYFRNSVDPIQKMKNDVYYAENYSFLMDCRIFFKTIKSVIKRDNVYRNVEDSKIYSHMK